MKLKLNTGKASSPDSSTPQSTYPAGPAAAAPPTPASTGSGGGFKLKLSASQPLTPATEHTPAVPAAQTAKKSSKPAQQPKSRKSTVVSKKRPANDDTISPAAKRAANGGPLKRSFSLKLGAAAPAVASQTSGDGLKRIKLGRKPTVPKLRALTTKRPPPQRLPGQGYDSEDSEAEEDPAIQQGFILRMQPGDDCDYLRNAIADGKIGLPSNEGGAEVSMRFLDKDFRRAVVTVRGRAYAAVLVDLPCIVETMKSWDKKGWWKVADVCQMLLVLGRCGSDDDAKNFPLPRDVDKENLQYAHGLTPPMHWVRKRRFRKRLSYKTIANVDEEVERLLKEDELAEAQQGEVKLDYFSRAELERSQEPGESAYDDDEDMDADGEPIETVESGQEYEYYMDEDDADLEGNLQAMFDEDQASSTPAIAEVTTDSPAPIADQAASYSAVESTMLGSESATETPAQDITTQDEQSSDESDYDDDEEDDEDSPDVMDEDAISKAQERNQQLEEVADLEREVENTKMKIAGLGNQLLKQRAITQLKTLEEDLRLKKASFGLDDDGDEDED